MKFYLIIALCAIAVSATPNPPTKMQLDIPDLPLELTSSTVEDRNVLLNILIRQLIAYVRNVINNGSIIFGIPPLDPLVLDHYHLIVPAGLINLDIEIINGLAKGFGGFVVHTSELNLRDLSFDLDISFPGISISADGYDLEGNLYNAIPLFGKGGASFEVTGFQFQAKLFLIQSEDEQSVLIDRIEDIAFQLPTLSTNLTGVIGGGDIDAIVNAIVDEVIVDYANRFNAAVGRLAGVVVKAALNPILNQLDTWKYIARFV